MKLKNICLAASAIISAIMVNNPCRATTAATTDENTGTGPRLIAIAGSTRKASCNQAALKVLVTAAIKAGATVKFIDLAEYDLPIYNQDLEEKSGLPANAKKLQQLIGNADGLLIASPEYNGLPTPLLLNVIAWASREEQGNPQSGRKIFAGKVAGIIAASPGGYGGKRGLPITRTLLSNLGVEVVTEEAAIPKAYEAFQTNGDLKDQNLSALLEQIAKSVVNAAKVKRAASS